MKHIALLMILLTMLLCGTCYAMTDEEIQDAIKIGQEGADRHKEFVYNEMDTDKTYGGFLGSEVKTMARESVFNDTILFHLNDVAKS
jgi:hypothetical protein